MIPLLATFGQTVFMLLLGSVAIFLILLVLVQRGRGGGLAGALGGMGGSSAFGAKAGDVFTKVTVVAATLWIVLCIAATKMTPSEESLLDTNVSGPLSTTLEGPALGAPVDSSEDAVAPDQETAGETEGETEGETDSVAPGASTSDATDSQPEQPPAAATESEQSNAAKSE